MKKLLTVLLALLLCFSLTACKNDEKESSETTVKETTITETVVETPVEQETTTTEEVVEVEDTTKVEEVKKENSTLSYWVNFLNKDGSVLQRTTYKYGETPTYNGSTPTYSDYAYYYSFKGWDKKTSPVYGTQTYTALYDIVGEVESKKSSSSNESTSTPNYLTFTAVTAGSSVTPNFASGTWEFSSDGGNTWTDGSSVGTLTFTKAGDSVMLRGTNCFTGNSNYFSMTGSIAASGDVTSLINGIGGDVALTDTYCYMNMFNGCTSLTTAPNLPSTTLTEACYAHMFNGCTSLTTAPTLPATTLAKSCYSSMFNGCTSLTTAPALPATDLAESCYSYMFYGCTSLTTAPELNVTTLAKTCYSNMFNGCTSLNIISSSTSLTDSNIYKIVSVASSNDANNMVNMFAGCGGGGITSVDSNKTYYFTRYLTFTAVELVDSVLSVNPAAIIMPMFNTGSYQYSMDGGVTWENGGNTTIIALTKIGNKVMLKGTDCTTDADNHFTFFGKVAASGDVTSLTNGVGGEADLTANCYSYMFCYNQGGNVIPNSDLTTAPNLPSIKLANSCYKYMFAGCASLTTVPTLPATTLAENCYENMFYDCTSLYVYDSTNANQFIKYLYKEWKIPSSGTFTNTYSQTDMFTNCKGTRSSNDMAGASGSSYTYYWGNN